MAKQGIDRFMNGATIRTKNKRIQIIETNGEVRFQFTYKDVDANKPACKHSCFKNKIRVTDLTVSSEMVSAIALAWIDYQKRLNSISYKN